ncbi:hypothetical protein RRG08_032654 [Elysia crispata]|uniref:G-protein coupled receptors family 1 profile domain-containing protein n=1 Tax=Elysia crispata TaxID=231223 RepID=A0AAE1CQ04_9GAST|nr:hypothetical protein RRG08_032654 [Elysia crispata]
MNRLNNFTTESSRQDTLQNGKEVGSDDEPESLAANKTAQKWVYVVFTVACLIVAIFILVCNMIFIAACWRTRSLRTLSTLFVISLAGSDMLQAVGMVLQALFYANNWIGAIMWTDSLCPWIQAVFLTCVPISILSVAFVAIDRYIYIIYPYRYPAVMTATRSKVTIAISWLLWVSFGFSILYQPKESSDCGVTTVVRSSYIYVRFAVFVISAILSGFCHASIQVVAMRHIRQVYAWSRISDTHNTPRGTSAVTPGGISISSLRLVKTFFLIYVSHVVCWTPALVTPTFRLSAGGLTNLFYILAELSACINVIVYVFSIRQFRRAIIKLIKCLPQFAQTDTE